MLCYYSPMVICRKDDRSRWDSADGPHHPSGNFTRFIHRQRGNARSATTQECSQRACAFRLRNDSRKIGYEPRAKRLMKRVSKVSAQRLIISTNERGGNSTGITGTPDRIGSINSIRQNFASRTGFYFVIRNQYNALQAR